MSLRYFRLLGKSLKDSFTSEVFFMSLVFKYVVSDIENSLWGLSILNIMEEELKIDHLTSFHNLQLYEVNDAVPDISRLKNAAHPRYRRF